MRAIVLLLVAWSGTVAAQPLEPCMQAYNAEVVAIEREAKARQGVGSDAAKRRAASSAETRLESAAKRAKACQEEAKAKPVPIAQKPPPADECKARVNARIAELERRFTGNPLDPAQQTLRREEEIKLQAELNECNRAAPPVGK